MGSLDTRPRPVRRIFEIKDALEGYVRKYFIRLRVYRATLARLNSLTDRQLADLGLRRGMLKELAKEAALRV